jgi:flagellar capping protein FliD
MYVVDPKVKQAIAKKTGFDYPGIRAKTLVNALNRHFEQMYETLAKNKKEFDTYMRTAKKELIDMQDSRKNDVMVARKTRNRVQNDLNELIDSYMITGKSWTEREKARYEEKKVDLEEKLASLDEQIADLQEKLEASEMTLDDFLNTIESLITSYQSRSGDDKLKIAEILVLNIFIKG